MHELVPPILEAAEHDPNVVGVLLKGSQSMGAADEESDWDVVVVLLEGEPSQKKDGLPYTEYWGGRLGELEPLILDVARTADPRRQQELQAAVEQIATAHGFRDVYDAWDGDIDRVMAFRFE